MMKDHQAWESSSKSQDYLVSLEWVFRPLYPREGHEPRGAWKWISKETSTRTDSNQIKTLNLKARN